MRLGFKHWNVCKELTNYVGGSHFNHGTWAYLLLLIWKLIWKILDWRYVSVVYNLKVCPFQNKPPSVLKLHEAHCRGGWKRVSKKKSDGKNWDGKRLRTMKKEWTTGMERARKSKLGSHQLLLGEKMPFLSFGAIIQHQRLYYGGLWKAKPRNPLQTAWRDRVWEIVNNCVLIANLDFRLIGFWTPC